MLNIEERHQFIIDTINSKGVAKVSELATVLGVTQATIRKDLSFLETKGMLQRSYGNAVSTGNTYIDVNLNTKRLFHFSEKQKIAKKASKLVSENESIIVSSGSTIAIFAEYLRHKKRLSVVTSSVNISMLLGDTMGIKVLQLEGMLYGNSMSVTGNAAIEKLKTLHCSKVFFGVDGIDPEHGVTCATPEEAEMTRQMMASSNQTIVLADSSKIGFCGLGYICKAGDIDILITDKGITRQQVKDLENSGLKIIIA